MAPSRGTLLSVMVETLYLKTLSLHLDLCFPPDIGLPSSIIVTLVFHLSNPTESLNRPSLSSRIMVLDQEKKPEIDTQHIEHIESDLGAIDKADGVPSIEEAAASQAAWLISVTVSLGG
jgi:hypothetical protein